MVQDTDDDPGDDLTSNRKAAEQSLHLPESFYIGQAAGQGDCFFDSVAQGLSQIRPKHKFTVKSLRMVCKEFAQRTLPSDSAHWLHKSLVFEEKVNKDLAVDRYIDSIGLTAAECENNPVLQHGSIWGRPEIEGRILCQEFGVKLVVAERHQCPTGVLWTNDRISATGSVVAKPQYGDEDTVHIVNYNGYHFEPILRRHCLQASRLQHLNDECDLESRRVDNELHRLGELFSGGSTGPATVRMEPLEPLAQQNAPGENLTEDPGAVAEDSVDIGVGPLPACHVGTLCEAVLSGNLDLVRQLLQRCPAWPFNHPSVRSDSLAGVLQELWTSMGVNEESVAGEMRALLEEEVGLRRHLLGVARAMSSTRDIARRSREGGGQPEDLIFEVLNSTSEALTTLTDFQERSVEECHHHKLTLLLLSLVAHNIERLQDQSDKLGLPRTLYLEVEDCLGDVLAVLINHERLKSIEDSVQRVRTELLQCAASKNLEDYVGKCDSLLQDIQSCACEKVDVKSVKRLLKHVDDLRDRIPAAKLQVEEIDNVSATPLPDGKEGSSSLLLVKERLILDELTRILQEVHQEDARWAHRFLLKRMLQLCDLSILKPLQSLTDVDGSVDSKIIWKKIQVQVQDASERLSAMVLGKASGSPEEVVSNTQLDGIPNYTIYDVNDGQHVIPKSFTTSERIDAKFGELLDCFTDNVSTNPKLGNHKCAQIICTRFVTTTTRSEIRRVVETPGKHRPAARVESPGHGRIAQLQGSIDQYVSNMLDDVLHGKDSEELLFLFPTNIADGQLSPTKSNLATISTFPSTAKTAGHHADVLTEIFPRISKFSSTDELLEVCKHNVSMRSSLEMLVWEWLKNLKATSSPAVYALMEDVLRASIPFAGHLPYCPFMSISLFDFLCPGSLLWAFVGDRMLATVLLGCLLATDGGTLMAIRSLLEVSGGCEFLLNSLWASFRDDVIKMPTSKFDKFITIVKASQYWKNPSWRRALMALLENGQVLEDGVEDQRFVWRMFELESFDKCNFKHIDFWRSRTNTAAIKGPRGYSLLHMACKVGDGSLIKDLLEHGMDVNATDDDCNAPLHIASYRDNIDIVQTLITNSAELNMANGRRLTALHIAASCGHLRVMEVLLKSGADIEAPTANGYTPLFFALPNTQAVKVLLEGGANASARNKENSSPLHESSRRGLKEAVKLLLEHGAKINAMDDSYGTPLHAAVVHGQADVVRTLLHHGADIYEVCRSRSTLVHHAAYCGHAGILKLLLEKGLKLDKADECGMTPLHSAVFGGHRHVLEILRLYFPTPAFVDAADAKKRTALHYAARQNDFRLIDTLLRFGASVDAADEDGRTYKDISESMPSDVDMNEELLVQQLPAEESRLFESSKSMAESSGTDLCQDGIQNGVQAESNQNPAPSLRASGGDNLGLAVPPSQWAPIHTAVVDNEVDIISTLLINKGGVDTLGPDNVTPLQLAAELGYAPCVDILLKKGADVNAVSGFRRRTALHLATRNGQVAIIKKLIQSGADINGRDEGGNTPLHLAAGGGAIEGAALLLDSGATIECRNGDGSTPLHLAALNGHRAFLEMLLVRNADINSVDTNGSTALSLAVQRNNVATAAALLSRGAKASIRNNDHWAPLHLAVKSDSSDAVRTLLDFRSDVNIHGKGGLSPLHLAVSKRSAESVGLLLAGGASVNERNGAGQSPLHVACQSDDCALVRILLGRGADTEAEDLDGFTPLLETIRSGHADVARELVSAGAKLNSCSQRHGWGPLHACVAGRKLDIMMVLVHGGASVNIRSSDRHTPLWLAAFYCLPEAVSLLSGKMADANAADRQGKMADANAADRQGKMADANAADRQSKMADANAADRHCKMADANAADRHCKMADANAADGHCKMADANAADRHCKMADANAADRHCKMADANAADGHCKMADANAADRHCKMADANAADRHCKMADANAADRQGKMADVNAADRQGNTVLHTAARTGHRGIVEALLASRANVNALNNRNWTPLHVAIDGRHRAAAEALLAGGASPDVPLENTSPALHQAAGMGDLDTVRLLDEFHADIGAPDRDQGQTPLHRAVANGHAGVARYLVSQGASVNATDSGGLTPLRLAIGAQALALIHFLLESGARVDATDGSQMAPLQAAVQTGASPELVQALLDCGAEVNPPQGLTPLHVAVAHGNLELAQVLLRNGADVHAPTGTSSTPLHVAAGLGHVPLVELLLESSAHLDARTCEGLTPLHEAAGEGHLAVVEALADRGADVNAADGKDHFRPLHCAACEGHDRVVEALLDRGAPVDAPLRSGKTALYLAVDSGRARAARALLDRGASVDARAADGSSMMHAAAISDDPEVIQLVLKATLPERGLEATNDRGDTALVLAAWSRKRMAADALLRLGARLGARNCKGFTGLHYAARNGDRDMVEVLCGAATPTGHQDGVLDILDNSGVLDILNNSGESALHLAVQSNHPEVVEVLLSKGASVQLQNSSRFTPLHLAAEQGFCKVVEVLCRFGADVNAANNVDLLTPLHLAAMGGHSKVVETLLQSRALLDQPLDGLDITPLYLAVQNGHAKAAKVLLDSGASPVVVKRPSSVLHAAVCSRRLDIVQMVVSKINSEELTAEPFLNAGDYAGDTPLMWAAQAGAADICKYLLNYGASVHLENGKRRTALHWAATNGHPDVVKLLLRYRAKRNPEDASGNTPLDLANSGKATQDGRGDAYDSVVKLLSRK